MITGAIYDWYVYPAGQTRPASPTRSARYFGINTGSTEDFNLSRDGLPVPGQKYDVDMILTVFETDEVPPNLPTAGEPRSDLWQPERGKDYRVLLQRTLRATDR
jgi:hypothetical protein